MNVAFVSATPLSLLSRDTSSFHPLISYRQSTHQHHHKTRPRRVTPIVSQLPEDMSSAPEGKVITRALEVTFRAVWVHLLTQGVGKAYETAMQEFVIACIAAFKAGYSLTALQLELSNNELRYKDSALNNREKETRLTWITLVYLTLECVGYKSERGVIQVQKDLGADSPVGKMVSGLTSLVDSVVQAARKGFDLQRFKMELSLKRDVGDQQLSGAEASIRSQWSRIVFMTLKVLPEELTGVPQPKSDE